jgi:glucose-1-phosphate adenylyltransferase
MQRTIAVIMGGGRGTRLDPLTRERAKPAVPLGGKYRLIDIPVSNCINSGLRRIFVLTQFNTASLHRHIRTTYSFDIFSHGYVNILAAEQTVQSEAWYQGTADAVRRNLRHLELDTADRVLILSGDQLYRMDFSLLLEQHQDSGADATIAVLPVPREQASAFGIVKAEGGGITGFVEKPKTAAELDGLQLPDAEGDRGYLASMGIYCFEREVLRELLAGTAEEDFGKQIIPEAIKRYRVHAFRFDGYWEDIGTIRAFYEANLELTRPVPRFDFFDEEAPIYTHPRNLPPAKMNGCRVERSVVADGCILDDCEITGSVIGVRTQIGAGSAIRDSVVMGLDYFENEERRQGTGADLPMGIGRHCRIEGAIIDKNCRLGDHVVIADKRHAPDSEGEYHVVRDGVIVIPRGTTIPPGTVI